MQVLAIHSPGPAFELRLEERPIPQPQPGEVLVELQASGLNRADLLQCRGYYPAPAGIVADIPGLEGAGTILGLGAGVEGFGLGERVSFLLSGGAWSKQVVVPAALLLPCPEDFSFEEAAAIPETFLTAWDGLEQLELVSGERLLVHAIGSGVGQAALQLAMARGASVIGSTRNQEKSERALAAGAIEVIDTQVEGWGKKLAAVDAVLDLVGGRTVAESLQALAPQGRLLLVGLLAGRRAELDLGLILAKRLSMRGTVLRSRSLAEKAALVASFSQHAPPVRAIIDRVYPVAEVLSAFERMSENLNYGKIVLDWSGIEP